MKTPVIVLSVLVAAASLLVGYVLLGQSEDPLVADSFDVLQDVLANTPLRSLGHAGVCAFLNSLPEDPKGDGKDDAKAFARLNGLPWRAPQGTEKVNVVLFENVAEMRADGITNIYYTGDEVPESERDPQEKLGVEAIVNGLRLACPCFTDNLLKRDAPARSFNHSALMAEAWGKFPTFRHDEIAFASNGDFGAKVLDARLAAYGAIPDVIGAALSETALGMFLRFDAKTNEFVVDLSDMAVVPPLPGFAPLGGRVALAFDGAVGKYGALRTTRIEYNGSVFTPAATSPRVPADSTWRGWQFAEKAVLASLVARLNLILHVKTVHLEVAAPLQAITLNAFQGENAHAYRRLMAPFVHRAIQVTNKNFDILYTYRVAEFSLAPLSMENQVKLMTHFVNTEDLSLATLDMAGYAKARGMSAHFSQRPNATAGANSRFFWIWNYRAQTAQALFRKLTECSFAKNFGANWKQAVTEDASIRRWWQSLRKHMRAAANEPERPSADDIVRVVSTLQTWVSWIHEDVGHSASSFVYNPVQTPMMVPLDGHGVPFRPFRFNVAAYRQFVFLQRHRLLDPAPDAWFDAKSGDSQCWADMQSALRKLGEQDDAFSNCGRSGFYSCVQDIETGVSS